MRLHTRFCLGLLLLVPALPALADKLVDYTIAPAQTKVQFSWTYMGLPGPGASFKEIIGIIHSNQDAPEKSWTEVSIPVRSLESSLSVVRQQLVESGSFFKVGTFPNITFRSTGMREIDRERRTFKLLGELTANGITKPLVMDVKATLIGQHPAYGEAQAAGFEAKARFKRSDFGMSGIPVVSDEITVTISVLGVEAEAYRRMAASPAAGKEK